MQNCYTCRAASLWGMTLKEYRELKVRRPDAVRVASIERISRRFSRRTWEALYLLTKIVAVTAFFKLFPYSQTVVAGAGFSYLLTVMDSTVFFGWRMRLAAAVLSVAAYNWFYLEPLYCFTVRGPANYVLLSAMLVAMMVTKRNHQRYIKCPHREAPRLAEP